MHSWRETDPEARKWATLCHISALVGLFGNGVGFLVAPLIVWLLKRDVHEFVNRQGKEAVNFQITMFIAASISGILALILIGFALLIAVGIVMTVFPIIAAIRANNGEDYRYPLTIRFIQ